MWISDHLTMQLRRGDDAYDTLIAQVLGVWFVIANTSHVGRNEYIYPASVRDLYEIWRENNHPYAPIFAIVAIKQYDELFDALYDITGPPEIISCLRNARMEPDERSWLESRLLKRRQATSRPPVRSGL